MPFGCAVIGLAYLEIRIFLAKHRGLPPSVQVMAEGACAHPSQSVLLADMLKFNSYIIIHNAFAQLYSIHEPLFGTIEDDNRKEHGDNKENETVEQSIK